MLDHYYTSYALMVYFCLWSNCLLSKYIDMNTLQKIHRGRVMTAIIHYAVNNGSQEISGGKRYFNVWSAWLKNNALQKLLSFTRKKWKCIVSVIGSQPTFNTSEVAV